MRLYSAYHISVDSSTCFGCWHPSSGARTTVITASDTGQPGLLPSAFVVEFRWHPSSGARTTVITASSGTVTIRFRCWVPLTPIIRDSYNCNYSFWHWSTGTITIRFRCWVPLTPIISSSYSCNYSFWHWSTGTITIRSHCWVGTQQRERVVIVPIDQCQKL